MRILIAEDDFVARRMLKDILCQYGDCDIVVDGDEAIQAFRLAWEENNPYDLICMDIMMPNVDGQESIKKIRSIENELEIPASDEVKIIMISVLGDPKTVIKSLYEGGATSYIIKPVSKEKILKELQAFGLVE